VNAFVMREAAPETRVDHTRVPGGPAGTLPMTATFTNTSDTPLRVPCCPVTVLAGDHRRLNAAEGHMGVGATLAPAVGDSVLAPDETVAVDFVIGLHTQAPFTFVVDLFGEPLL
jgi:hypothetical protein